jgi:hypothetical protein
LKEPALRKFFKDPPKTLEEVSDSIDAFKGVVDNLVAKEVNRRLTTETPVPSQTTKVVSSGSQMQQIQALEREGKFDESMKLKETIHEQILKQAGSFTVPTTAADFNG